MELSAEIEIRPADQSDAIAILQCLTAAFTPYRAEYSPAAFADTVPSDDADALTGRERKVDLLDDNGFAVTRRDLL